MLRAVLLFNLILCPIVIPKRRFKEKDKSDFDEQGILITSLRDDKNLDLSMDEEYEDLRAELLAYHTALASLTGPRVDEAGGEGAVGEGVDGEGADGEGADGEPLGGDLNTRRSMKTTPCWQLGGICVKNTLCKDTRFLTEVPGCKNNNEVCCFTWNKFEMKDLRDKGIGNIAYPWSKSQQLGGKGLIAPIDQVESEKSLESVLPVYNIPVILSSIPEKKKKKKHHRSTKDEAPILVIVKPNKP